MNSENGHGVLSALERAGMCQSTGCRAACSVFRRGCPRLLAERRIVVARTMAASAIDHAVPDAGASVLERIQ